MKKFISAIGLVSLGVFVIFYVFEKKMTVKVAGELPAVQLPQPFVSVEEVEKKQIKKTRTKTLEVKINASYEKELSIEVLSVKYKDAPSIEVNCKSFVMNNRGEQKEFCSHLVDIVYLDNGDVFYEVQRTGGKILPVIRNYPDGYENGFNIDPDHSYVNYTLEEVIQLSDQGDKDAQVFVLKKIYHDKDAYTEEDVALAKKYAIKAFKQGRSVAFRDLARIYSKLKKSTEASAYEMIAVESYPKYRQQQIKDGWNMFKKERLDKVKARAEELKKEIYLGE